MKEPSEFKKCVLAVVKAIPRGKTLSYEQVAQRAGSPGAARAVGTIMRSNNDPDVPCHRVIKSDGQMGGYNQIGGSERKRQRLIEEGAIK